jgi:hypothetical protein
MMKYTPIDELQKEREVYELEKKAAREEHDKQYEEYRVPFKKAEQYWV